MLFLFFTLLLLFFRETNCIQCGQNGKCPNSVTEHHKYGYCHNVTNECLCREDRGFVGNATPQWPCQCPPELDIFRDSGEPWCTSLKNGVQYQLDKARNDHIISVEMGMYTELIYPRSAEINFNLINGIPDRYLNYFTNDTKGRVSPVGTFSGLALVVEYYVGSTVTGATRIVNVSFNAVGAYNNTGWVSTNLGFHVMNAAQNQTLRSYILTQMGYDRHNENGIHSADKDILNLNAAVNWVGTLNFSSPALHLQICTVLITLSQCNATRDPLGYFASIPECTAFMGNRTPGDLGDTLFRADTVACSYFHMVFTRADPVNHCPHAGKTGGGKCITTPYIQFYSEVYRKRMELEITAENVEATLNEILLGDRLNLILSGIPQDSPLVTLPLNNMISDIRKRSIEEHMAGNAITPFAKTEAYINAMKANNYALHDSIFLPQAKSLIAAGISPNHPMIAEPLARLAQRLENKRRSGEFYILDMDAFIEGETNSRDASYYFPSHA